MNGEHFPVKTPSQAAIGRALGIAPPTVTKHKAAGMPVDSIESARAWYKTHTNIAQRKRRALVIGSTVPPEPAHHPQLAQPQASAGPSVASAASNSESSGAGLAADRRADFAGLAEEFDSARTREKIAEANLAEMEEAKQRGEYLIKADFERHLFTAGRMLRDTLTNCSRRIGAEVAGSTNPDECEAIIDREHRAALASFAQALRMSIKVHMETPA